MTRVTTFTSAFRLLRETLGETPATSHRNGATSAVPSQRPRHYSWQVFPAQRRSNQTPRRAITAPPPAPPKIALLVERVPEALRVAVASERHERLGFDLADALAGDAEALADLLEAAWVLARKAEAQLDA